MDGKWILDPLNQASVSNPFGGRNSVMTVALSDQQKHMMDAEQAPLLNAYETKSEQNRNRLDAVSNKMELAGKGPKWRAIMDLMAATEARPQTLQ
jgi:hypothetical protein